MTTLQSIPRTNPDVIARDLGEETIIISSRGDMLHTLDAVGTCIWRCVDGRRSVAEIVSLLMETYEVTESIAERDVLLFFEELERKAVVKFDLT